MPPSPESFAVVVNDDPIQLRILSGLVRKAGLAPRPFTGAEDALTQMSAWAAETPARLPALVITDLYMPGIDGWRFCRLLRSPEYFIFNPIPILVVSATFAGDEADRIARDLGAEAFLPAPVDGTKFFEKVQALQNGEQIRTPPRVLIVEDSPTQAGIIRKAFTSNGYRADVADTVAAAGEAFEKSAYDAAVLDYHLPDGTGDTLLDAFRRRQPDCVCLMMTIDTSQGLALDWMKRGAAAYLQKPFEPGYLIELCARARREHALLRVENLIELRTRELRESEERFRMLFNSHASANLLIDANTGAVLDANAAAARFYGWPLEILRKMTLRQIAVTQPEKGDGETAHAASAASGKCRHRRADGSIRDVELFSNPIEIAGKPLRYATVIDTTERKLAEEKRVMADLRTRALMQLNQMTEASLQEVTDFALEEAVRLTRSTIGYLAFVSDDERVLTMHSWSKSAMAACTMADKPIHYPVAQTGLWGEAVRQRRPVITNDYTAASPLKKGCPEGHVALFRHMNIPVIADGSIVLVAGVGNKNSDYDSDDVRQLTLLMEGMWRLIERKRAREELLHINKTLAERVAQAVEKNMEQERLLIRQSRLAAMGEMIGNIAHQWRQPLNALGLLLYNIKEAYQYQTIDAAFLDQAIADGNRLVQKMSTTISDFSNFFRPDKGITPFSAVDQIREAAALVAASFQHGNIGIHIDAPQDLKLLGFPNEYSQVLLNLLTNAKDAILARPLPHAGRVDIAVSRKDGEGLVRVRDNGGGIAEDILDRIFDPYFSTKEKGSGIGLYMSKMIIERNMNGRITARNIAGGAEFTISSPLAAVSGDPGEPRRPNGK